MLRHGLQMGSRGRKGLLLLAAAAALGPWAAAVLLKKPPVDPALRSEQLEARFEALKPLHVPPPAPKPGDWLAEHPEPGESFATYVKSDPVRPIAARRTIYLQPLGDFSPAQLQVLERTADYVARFFQLPVTTLPALPATSVPAEARRGQQLLTTYILERILIPSLPEDGVAMIALTSEDLYPAPGWNFVFGEASPVDRVGVWSLFRNGVPGTALYLSRTLKTATHELGHMLSIPHCVAWSCVMDGSNSLEESDLQPASLCPVCLQKLTWNVGLDPARRFEDLAAFQADAGMTDELAFTQRALQALKSAGP